MAKLVFLSFFKDPVLKYIPGENSDWSLWSAKQIPAAQV